MKRILKVLMVVILATVCAGTASAEFRFGIKAGLNVNKLSLSGTDWKDTFKADNGCGFTGGVMAEFTVPIIGIGADVAVMYTRMNSDASNDYVELMKSSNNNFLEIPLNIKYKLTLPVVSKFLKPYVFTGPSFAFKLDKNTIDALKTKTCQTAWNIGLGLEFVNHVQVGASYGFGINNIAKWTNAVNAVDNVKVKNNYWTVTAAYLF